MKCTMNLKNRNNNVVDCLIFGTIIFVKCVLFHYFCFKYVAVSSFYREPTDFLAFYFSKFLPAIFISSFVFLGGKRNWTILISVIIDLWMSVNLVYFNVDGLFVDIHAVKLIGNLNGFFSSVATYLDIKVFSFWAITVLYAIYVYRNKQIFIKRNILGFVVCYILIAFIFIFDFLWGYGKENKFTRRNPIQVVYNTFHTDAYPTSANKTYMIVERGSIIHSIFTLGVYAFHDVFYKEKIEFTDSERKELNSIMNQNFDTTQLCSEPLNNVVLFLVESLETWALSFADLDGRIVAPNILNLLNEKNVFFCPKIRSQARAGISGDGQMIVNTGLLPLSDGAACMLYGDNVYPNVAHLYPHSVIVDGCGNFVWNQPVVTKSYGYKSIIPSGGKSVCTRDDNVVMNYLEGVLDTIQEPFFVQVITVSTHSPWDEVPAQTLRFPNDIPTNLSKYLEALHYTDSCIGRIVQDSLLSNTTIVITGDHTVFKNMMLQEFRSFSEKYNYDIPHDESFCPLIIKSPKIAERQFLDEQCYQMDIFPTIMHCIGVDNYYWKGFGVNLLDSVARQNRIISEEDAYILSDKIIRGNYFYNLK